MAIGSPALLSVDWFPRIINVSKDYMSVVQLTPTEIRELNTIVFHQDLRNLLDDEEGIPYLDTHNFVGPITVGGVALAQVIEIINGYTLTFEENLPAGSPPCPVPYAVNLQGSNNNIADVTNVNSVSIRSANSAGLTYSKQAEDSSFEDARVWINTVTGETGTQYPIGTIARPVNNKPNALGIISARSLPNRVHVFGELDILVSGVSSIDVLGQSESVSHLHFGYSGSPRVFASYVDITDDSYANCFIDGFITGRATYTRCTFGDLEGIAGDAINCSFKGNLILAGGAQRFIDCYSSVAGTDTPELDCNSIPNTDVSIRDYTGGLLVTNFISGSMTIDLNSGHIQLDPTVTGGTIVARGTGHLTDNSGPGCTVVTSGLVEGDAGGRSFGGM